MIKDRLVKDVKLGLARDIQRMQRDLEDMENPTSADFYRHLVLTGDIYVRLQAITDYLKEESSSLVFEGDRGAASRYSSIVYTFKDGSSVKIRNNIIEQKGRFLYAYLRLLTKPSSIEG